MTPALPTAMMSRTRQREQLVRDRSERFLEIADARLWVVSDGVAGPLVVVLHGGPGLPDYTEPIARLLTDRFRVHRYDQRGAGRSDRRPPWTLEGAVADLDGIRQALELERWHVVGHSWGATLGLLYALQHPSRTSSLAYLSGTGLAWSHWVESYRQEQRQRWTPGEQQRYDELRARARPLGEEVELIDLELRADTLPTASDTDMARTLAAGINRKVNRQLNQEVDRLDPTKLAQCCSTLDGVPVLVVHGQRDPRPAEAVADLVTALPHVVTLFMDAGHELWREGPSDLRDGLRRHIESAEARQSPPT